MKGGLQDYVNKYTDGKPGRIGSALLVPPAPEKIAPESLKDVWDLAKKILGDSTEIIIFGFAFNPYDEALLNFLEVNGVHLKRVLLIDLYPKKAVARKLWPNAKVTVVSNVDEIMVEVDLWLQHTATII